MCVPTICCMFLAYYQRCVRVLAMVMPQNLVGKHWQWHVGRPSKLITCVFRSNYQKTNKTWQILLPIVWCVRPTPTALQCGAQTQARGACRGEWEQRGCMRMGAPSWNANYAGAVLRATGQSCQNAETPHVITVLRVAGVGLKSLEYREHT
jgi:hypothetical protein